MDCVFFNNALCTSTHHTHWRSERDAETLPGHCASVCVRVIAVSVLAHGQFLHLTRTGSNLLGSFRQMLSYTYIWDTELDKRYALRRDSFKEQSVFIKQWPSYDITIRQDSLLLHWELAEGRAWRDWGGGFEWRHSRVTVSPLLRVLKGRFWWVK